MNNHRIFTLLLTCSSILISCKKNKTTPEPPVVTVQASSTLQLPTDSLKIVGNAVANNGATIVAYTWSQVSGPGNATIVTTDATSTTIEHLLAGTYIFKLSATDSKGLSGSAVDTVTVNPLTVLSLAPANNPDEVELWGYNAVDMGTNPTSPELFPEFWTVNGNYVVTRGLLRFDFSSIPATAVIVSAQLSLFSDSLPSNGDLTHANYGLGDSMAIRQVTSSWTGSTVNWTTQPSVTSDNEVLIPATALSSLNLTSINVTAIVSNIVSNNANYGFEMVLQNELAPYICRIFCSSKFSDATRHPSVTIQYYVP